MPFKLGVAATLAIAVAANIAVLGNLGVLFGQAVPGATNENLYAPYLVPLRAKSMSASEFGIFRPVYDHLATLLGDHADTALYQVNGGLLREGSSMELFSYLYATPALAKVLGVRVVAGRSLRPSDMVSGAAPVIVVSAKLARSRFGSFDAALDKTLIISGISYRIVGILPSALQFPSKRLSRNLMRGLSPQAWIPLPPEPPGAVSRLDHQMYAIIHPHAGLSVAGLKAVFAQAWQQALPEYTPSARARIKNLRFVTRVSSLADHEYGPVLTRLKLLELAALLLLLLVFINLVGLATSDAIARRHELATRAALGARGWGLFIERFRMFFGLAVLGWIVGIGLGWLGQHALADAIGQAGSFVALSAPVLLLTLGSMVVIAALLATIGVRRVGKSRHLIEDLVSGGGVTGGRKMVHFMRSLIALQLAASVVLLVLAAHFYVNVFGLTHNKLGFKPSQRSSFTVLLPSAGPDQVRQFDQKFLRRLNRRSDIKAASLLSLVPLEGGSSTTAAGVNPALTAEHVTINQQLVSKNIVQAMGLNVLAGDPRAIFSGADHEVFIDSTAAAKFWPGVKLANVVGRSLYIDIGSNKPYRVEAVVAALRMKPYGSIGGTFFMSYKSAHELIPLQSFVVRSLLPPSVLHDKFADAMRAANPSASILEFHPVKNIVESAYTGRIQIGRVFGVLAVIALFIAAIGLFALLAYRSLVRRPEFAIRGALGATPWQLRRTVFGETGIMWVIGSAIGIPVAYGTSMALAGYLPSLGLPAAWVVIAVVAAMGIAALIAAFVPARRAAGTDLSSNLSV